MLDYCVGCSKADEFNFEGLHPFVTVIGKCTVYDNNTLGWVERRGCSFNAPIRGGKKVKLNPLKASKRARR